MTSGVPIAAADIGLILTFADPAVAAGLRRPRGLRISPGQPG